MEYRCVGETAKINGNGTGDSIRLQKVIYSGTIKMFYLFCIIAPGTGGTGRVCVGKISSWVAKEIWISVGYLFKRCMLI